MADRSLTSFIEEVSGDSHLRVEDDLGDGFVRLRSAEAERRQARHDIRSTEDIVIEMLRNARDAHARSIFVALSREGTLRRICMVDDGDGIPIPMQPRVFEPRVTSKLDTMHVDKWGVHGRGMALFSIAENARSACVVASDKGKGASLAVETDLEELPEKADQSSMPVFGYDSEGELQIRGPRNINRLVCEFAYEHRSSLSVYCGSPTDIAATLYDFGMATVSSNARAFATDASEFPVAKRLCLAIDPESFAELAAAIGLPMSQRSARRILDGSIRSLESIADSLVFEDERTGHGKASKRHGGDARGLRIDGADLTEFSTALKTAFADLAQRYYLESDIEPDIRVSREGIRVNFPVSKLL
ncbi:ATP-binding protein [Raoultibacter phocaeensis]|uniref:ATP-binding protein n=1 Tax=Raoultibacter phocaeensis TaxID=2479841 RepID=UPI00111ADC09|nr:ATP-binding protein [Raoultibacter phocaeensis]